MALSSVKEQLFFFWRSFNFFSLPKQNSQQTSDIDFCRRVYNASRWTNTVFFWRRCANFENNRKIACVCQSQNTCLHFVGQCWESDCGWCDLKWMLCLLFGSHSLLLSGDGTLHFFFFLRMELRNCAMCCFIRTQWQCDICEE